MIGRLELIPHNRPTMGPEEEEAALRVLKTGWIAQGSEVENLENEFCDFLRIPRGLAVAVSSGTAALYLALLSLEAKGKMVSFPAYACSALRNATALAGGIPLLIDSGKDSPKVNLSDIRSTDIAIIPHMYGIPQSLESRDYLVIEDCAQSLGATVNHVPAGLQGDIGIYSFYATKLMSAGGQGGMIVSKDQSIIDYIKDYRSFDRRKDAKYRFNFQMTDLQAAIGRAQLKKLPQFLKRREEIYQKYKNAGLPLLDDSTNGITPVRYRAILKTGKQYEILNELGDKNIKPVIPLQDWELLGPKEQFPNAFEWTQNTVSLPIYPTLTDEEADRIVSVITGVS